MWLRAERAQRVRIAALDLTVEFAAGEEILTEVSCKFRAGRGGRRTGPGGAAAHPVVDRRRRRLRVVAGGQVSEGLAEAWRAARPPVAGLHLDSAACSRQSFAVLDAAARHARHEAEVGGYVAAEAAKPVLDAGRAAVAALAGMPDAEVVFTTGSLHALDLLLASWPPGGRDAGVPSRRIRTQPGRHGRARLRPPPAADRRRGPGRGRRSSRRPGRRPARPGPPDRGGQPPRSWCNRCTQMAQLCAELGLPLVVDAAQALGQVDCAAGADVTYASSRKWIAGPRGVGVLAVRPTLMQRLRPRLPPPEWVSSLSVAQRLELGEANVAARVGFSVALGEHVAFGPAAVRARLAEVGRHQPDRTRRRARVAGGRIRRRAQRHHHTGPRRRCRPGRKSARG